MGSIMTGNILITAQNNEKLERADIQRREAAPRDSVTRNSTVRVRDLDTKQESVYTLVSPHQADVAHGRVSVLAPIGAALLGCHEGDIVEWHAPARFKRIQILEVVFQPGRVGRGL
jgi:regulator of nucleoside diphosphate kinase